MYKGRIIDHELKNILSFMGFVLIEGPKAVGKTESAKQVAKTVVRLDIDENARILARTSPLTLLEGDVPLLIDEWQLAPGLWAHVKVEVDARQLPGQFILTGSSIPSDDGTRDTGAGRVGRLKIRPMTLFETGHSKGTISLAGLFSHETPSARDPGLSVRDIAERICIGGWPAFQSLEVNKARAAMKSYLFEIAGLDVQRVSGIRFNKNNVLKVLKSLARNVGTKASDSTIAKDAGSSGNPLDRKVTASYLEALERVMVTENSPAWTPQLRSRARINSSETRYFIDPALAAAASAASPSTLLAGQIKLLGFYFENLVVRDLRVYMQAFGGEVKQYRDETGLEVDIILETLDNAWAAIEVKLGVDQVDGAAASLLKFREKIDTIASGEPVFMAIVTATGPAYVREDGIYVIPIGVLGP
ncbi:MAG: ATP-binding protein [Actinobacteria bacterium]|nr:ATP-binding protein [Actinomycetota bacterium]